MPDRHCVAVAGRHRGALAQGIHNLSAIAPTPCRGSLQYRRCRTTWSRCDCSEARAGASFTGADRKAQVSKFRLANGGTLFLDEIGDRRCRCRSAAAGAAGQQVEPLRLELGGGRSILRVIAATHVDLEDRGRRRRFRDDLYYRPQR